MSFRCENVPICTIQWIQIRSSTYLGCNIATSSPTNNLDLLAQIGMIADGPLAFQAKPITADLKRHYNAFLAVHGFCCTR
jgi:hypothetical protein